MKCLWHYEWVKLPRNIVPEGKGVLGKAGISCGISKRNFPVLWLHQYCDSGDVGWWRSWAEKYSGNKEPEKGIGYNGKIAAIRVCPL